MRVGFNVRGFSTSGGAPAIICRARLAASTTYANWLSGALVSTFISLFLQKTPEVVPPACDASRSDTVVRRQSPALRCLRALHLHSRHSNRSIFRTLRSRLAPSPNAARFPRPNPGPGFAGAAPTPRAIAAHKKSPPTPEVFAFPVPHPGHRSRARDPNSCCAIPRATFSACHTHACRKPAHTREILRETPSRRIPLPLRKHSTSHWTQSHDAAL